MIIPRSYRVEPVSYTHLANVSDTYARNIVDNVDRAVNEADRLIHRTFYGCKGVVHGRLEGAAEMCIRDSLLTARHTRTTRQRRR